MYQHTISVVFIHMTLPWYNSANVLLFVAKELPLPNLVGPSVPPVVLSVVMSSTYIPFFVTNMLTD